MTKEHDAERERAKFSQHRRSRRPRTPTADCCGLRRRGCKGVNAAAWWKFGWRVTSSLGTEQYGWLADEIILG